MAKNRDKEKISFKYNFSEYWGFLKKYKLLFGVILFLILLTEGLLIIDKFLFKIIIDNGTEFVNGNLAQEIFIKTLIIVAGIFIGALMLRTVGKWFSTYFLHILEGNLMQDLKKKYLNHIVRLSHKFHTTHKTGALISRMHRGTWAADSMTDILTFQFAPLVFNLVVVGFSLVYFNVASALVILGITIAFISYSFLIQQVQQDSKLRFNSDRDTEKALIGDVFTNIDSIKYFGKEWAIQTKFSKITQKTKESLWKYWSYYQWFDAGHFLILGVGSFFLVYFPLMEFLAGEITIGTLVFIFTIYVWP